jgi:hypothetical protein
MDSAFPATTPLMLDRYAAIAVGDARLGFRGHRFDLVRDGRGTSAFNGDVFMLPGGSVAIHTAAEHAVLWLVSNEP